MTSRRTWGRKPSGALATQAWFPIREIKEGCLFRDDGAVMGGVSLAPLNLALKSPRETRAILTAVYAIFNSMRTPWQLLSLYRPLDLAHYVESLQDQLRRVNAHRAALLRPYLAWVLAQQAGEQAMERRYYCLSLGPGRMRWRSIMRRSHNSPKSGIAFAGCGRRCWMMRLGRVCCSGFSIRPSYRRKRCRMGGWN